MASNTIVNTNVLALNANRNLGKVASTQTKASQKLSSGLKINSAADDAAGLAISETMRAQIRGLDMASKNGQDGISLIQTVEGGTQEIGNMIQRIRELSVQSATDTNTGEDRAKINVEVQELMKEIAEMSERVEFNGMKVLGSEAKTITAPGPPPVRNGSYDIHIGANDGQVIKLDLTNVADGAKMKALVGEPIASPPVDGQDVTSKAKANLTLAAADEALEELNTYRATLGAYQNRIEYTTNSLDISSENLSAAESRIRDTDMAKEMMTLTKANVLQQAATSMLAQANQAPQGVLKLLQ